MLRQAMIISIFLLTSISLAAETVPLPQGEKCDVPPLLPSARAAAKPISMPSNFPAYLIVLGNSNQVVLGAVGVAGTCDIQCKAYIEAYKNRSNLRKELEWMLKNASVAGKLYAAILIHKVDKTRGVQALESLKSEPTPVYFSMGGCVGGSLAPVAEHAKGILMNPRRFE